MSACVRSLTACKGSTEPVHGIQGISRHELRHELRRELGRFFRPFLIAEPWRFLEEPWRFQIAFASWYSGDMANAANS